IGYYTGRQSPVNTNTAYRIHHCRGSGSLPLQSFAAVRSCKIDNRSEWHDPSRINFLVRHVIMTLDVIDADGLGDSRLLIQVEQITLQVRIIDDATEIAFEMAVINDIETNERAKKSPVGFDDAVSE